MQTSTGISGEIDQNFRSLSDHPLLIYVQAVLDQARRGNLRDVRVWM